MSGQNGNNFAVQGDEDILISSVNDSFGKDGAGSVGFWDKFNPYVFRDSITQEGGLDFPNGYYNIFTTRGATYEYKGRMEERSFEEEGGEILIGPAKCERIDGPAVIMDAVRGSGRRRRLIETAIGTDFRLWAEHLPMRQIVGLMVNNRISSGHATVSGTGYLWTKGAAFFATDHRVNPMDETNTATFSNLITLGGTWNETRWGTAKDTILQTPDMDGQTLRAAAGFGRPLAMVGTVAQAIRMARVFGPVGSGTTNFLIESASGNAGVTGVVVGEVEIMVNPYLVTLAEAANLATVQGRTYIFPGGIVRRPFIFREEMAPQIDQTGNASWLRHKRNAEAMYIQAAATAIFGDPRGCVACDES